MVQSKLSPNCQFNWHILIKSQIWEYFLAYSTIIARQGSATCYQITLVKNLNSTHRIEGIATQFALSGALSASKVDIKTNLAKSAVGTVQEKVGAALS